jgi:hypothetical protein
VVEGSGGDAKLGVEWLSGCGGGHHR